MIIGSATLDLPSVLLFTIIGAANSINDEVRLAQATPKFINLIAPRTVRHGFRSNSVAMR